MRQMESSEGSGGRSEQRLKNSIKLPRRRPSSLFSRTDRQFAFERNVTHRGHGANCGRVGAELMWRLAKLPPCGTGLLAVARQHLGSLDRVTRIVRSVSRPLGRCPGSTKVADAASGYYSARKDRTRAAWFMASRAFRLTPSS
jgi:hypothetical protein